MSQSEDAVFTLYDTMRLSPQALREALHRCNPNLPVGVPNRYDGVMRLRIIPMSVLGGETPFLTLTTL
jgi:hypothetical protein